jgi:teichuronic acid biosynthesis glycosyltransferase TuaC
MRILAVTNMYPTALAPGMGIFVEQQIEGLRRIGLDVNVLFLDRVQDGMTVYKGLVRQLRSRIKYFQPDLIHVMYGGVMAGLVTKSVKDRPVIITFHGTDLLGEHLSGFLKNLIAGCGVVASWRAAQCSSGIVIVSKSLQDALPKDVNAPVRIIPCGIDLERFKPLDQDACRAKLGWNPNRLHVLFPSNTGNPVKRPELAQAAVDVFNRSGIRAELHFLRGVPNKEVPKWINASDVLIMTSLHEGSPTILKEALACNVPVVSVDVGDVRDQIQGIAGCHLALAEPDDLAAKLSIVCSGTRRVKARDNMQRFSLDRISTRLHEFYTEIVNSFNEQQTLKN